jgi:hypothetical protein
MKNNSTKKLRQLAATNESSALRLAYKNEEIINTIPQKNSGKEKPVSPAKAPTKLFVKEPLPLFNDYKFKAKDHDPL